MTVCAIILANSSYERFAGRFERWSRSLYDKRWGCVSFVCEKLLPLPPILRATYNVEKYIQSQDREDEDVARGIAEAEAGTVQFEPREFAKLLASILSHADVISIVKSRSVARNRRVG